MIKLFRQHPLTLVTICFTYLALSGCDQSAAADEMQPISTVSRAIQQPDPIIVQPNLLENHAELTRAKQLLQARPEFSGSSIHVFEKIHFFDGVRPRIELAVQNPAIASQLTFYTYENGVWTPSEAEDISHIKNLNKHLVNLDEVDFLYVPMIAKLWRNQAQNTQAVINEPYYIAWVYLPKQQKRFWHTATIEAIGAQYYLSAHENGQIWEFKQLNTTTNEK